MIKAANKVNSAKDFDWREDLKAAYNNPANTRFAQAIELMFADLDSAKSEAINPTNTIGRVATIRLSPNEKFSLFLDCVHGVQA